MTDPNLRPIAFSALVAAIVSYDSEPTTLSLNQGSGTPRSGQGYNTDYYRYCRGNCKNGAVTAICLLIGAHADFTPVSML